MHFSVTNSGRFVTNIGECLMSLKDARQTPAFISEHVFCN
jgi:hypothetical protein